MLEKLSILAQPPQSLSYRTVESIPKRELKLGPISYEKNLNFFINHNWTRYEFPFLRFAQYARAYGRFKSARRCKLVNVPASCTRSNIAQSAGSDGSPPCT